MDILSTSLQDLKIAVSIPRDDLRGSFSRLFCKDKLVNEFGKREIVQINHSKTTKVGAVRGLHFQYTPHAEMKMVRCLKGKVWDVAVDLRKNSSTFLKWHGEELSPKNARLMIIPEGFAHGFQVLEPNSELLYLHTDFYTPSVEGGVRFDDPAVGISWPLSVSDISDRDAKHPFLGADFGGLST